RNKYIPARAGKRRAAPVTVLPEPREPIDSLLPGEPGVGGARRRDDEGLRAADGARLQAEPSPRIEASAIAGQAVEADDPGSELLDLGEEPRRAPREFGARHVSRAARRPRHAVRDPDPELQQPAVLRGREPDGRQPTLVQAAPEEVPRAGVIM